MYKNLYKKSGVCEEEMQETRRRALLEDQKQKRLELQDLQRDFKIVPYKSKRKARSFQEIYGNDLGLQLSEWLRERPDDLCEWFLVPCPRGQRCLLVAQGGRTEMYSKSGRRQMIFKSLLPNGGADTGGKFVTILDCVYVKALDSFYVLDVLVFANQDLVNCEAQFRFFWLRCKFEEHDQLGNAELPGNEKSIVLLPQYDFENMERISIALQRYPQWSENNPELDGFLFYHKEASYTCGTTPLVLWLFGFMVPEVLGLAVSPCYEKPAEYESAFQYMEFFDEQMKQRQGKHRKSNEMKMEEGQPFEVENSRKVADDDDKDEFGLENILDKERNLEMEVLDDDDTLHEGGEN